MKNGPERELCKRYLDRFTAAGKPLGLTYAGLTEIAESRASSVAERVSVESASLQNMLKKGVALIILDERGKNLPSLEFARKLAAMRDDGVSECLFALGGPDGHAPKLRSLADMTLSFGLMAWPHQLARVMLAEQLYRAATILSGHPYHRE